MISKYIKLLCLLSLLLLPWHSLAITSPSIDSGPVVDKVTQIGGYTLTGVKAIIQSESGFMWLATSNGLLRYDGHELKHFVHDHSNPHSLVHNDVRGLVEDTQGYIWLITRGGGLSRFSPSTEQFDNFRHDSTDDSTIDSNQLNDISLGADDQIWIASNQGINRFDSRTLSNLRLNSSLQPSQLDIAENIHKIYLDSQQRLWFSIRRKGLFLHLFETGKTMHFTHEQDNEHSLDANMVSRIYETRSGDIWVGTAVSINRFNAVALNFDRFVIPLKQSNKVNQASVTSIFEDHSNGLWIGTFYNGVSYLPAQSRDIVNVNQGVNAKDSLNALHINDIYQDHSGSLWFVTPRRGLIKLSSDAVLVSHQQVRANIDFKITALLSDSKGTLWLGSNHGLYQYNVQEKQFLLIDSSVGHITGLLEGLDQRLIIAVNNRGVVSFDVNNNDTKLIVERPDVNLLSIDPLGKLWTGLSSGGLLSLDNLNLHLSNMTIEVILALERYVVVGTKNQGIQLFDSHSNQWQAINGVSSVTSLYQDKNQHIWVGNQAGGLSLLDIENNRLNSQSGDFGIVKSMVEDNDGFLWLTSDIGLLKFDTLNQQLSRFDYDNGLRISSIQPDMSIILPFGDIMMAGETGSLRFSPDQLTLETDKSQLNRPIMLTEFKLFNQPVLLKSIDPSSPLTTTIDKTDEIVLSHQQNWISIAFASGIYRPLQQLRYAYMMQGLSDQWIQTSAEQRIATFSYLKAGDYVFKVKVTDASGDFNDNVRTLKITVRPVWWKTNIAYAFYILSLLLLIYLFNYVRTRQLRSRAASLEHGIAERTIELRDRAATISALLADKDRLIANISHEFRTPLTLILGPLQSELKSSNNEASRKALTLAQANSYRLLAMVDQLLDLARFKDLPQAALKRKRVFETCELLIESFRMLAQQRQIELLFDCPPSLKVDVHMQPDALEKILCNLLSNAFKYGGYGQKITVAIYCIDEQVHISVTDTGQGISETDQQQVFKRFTRLKHQGDYVPGAGIGLALVKELVEQHQGQIKLQSELTKGSVFTVILPVMAPSDSPLNDTTIVNKSLLEQAAEQTKYSEAVINNQDTVIQPVTESAKQSVLIIEDNQQMRHYIVSCLAPTYHCMEAVDGEEGIQMAQKYLPDLVVSDVMMPKMDGFEVTKKLKSADITNHIPVVLLTARGDRQSRIKGWAEKADEFLEKPFNHDELLSRIGNLLSIRLLLRKRFQGEFAKPVQDNGDNAFVSNVVHQVFVDQVNSVLDKHYTDVSFGVSHFADHMALSHRQLGRKIKSLLDMTPAETIRQFRLKKAAEQLSQGVSPSVVAHKAGFTTHSYFSQCFKAQYGCIPSQYSNENGHKAV